MIEIAAWLEPEELKWLRDAAAQFGVQRNGADCEISCASTDEQWQSLLAENTSPDLLVLDLRKEEAITQLAMIRKKLPNALIVPLVNAEISPLRYVTPDILPYGLLWLPIAQEENRRLLYQTMKQLTHSAPTESEDCFMIKGKQSVRRIPYGQIYCFEAQNKKINLRTREQEFTLYETIAHLEETVPKNFLRCHKSYLVNREHITSVNWTDQTVVLDGDVLIPLSRTYRKQIKEALYEA